MGPKRARFWAAAAAASLCFLAVGCQLDVTIGVAVDRRGGGEVTVRVSADDELLRLADEQGVDLFADLVAAGRRWRDWRVEDDEGEAGRTIVLRRRFRRAEEFNRVMRELAEALAAPEARLVESLAITAEQETVQLAGGVSLQPTEAVADHGLHPEDAVRLLAETGALRFSVEATMPGTVLQTTATQVDDRDLQWHVLPGERVEILAVAERGGGPLWPAVAVGVLLTLAGVAVAVLGGRRRARPRPSPPA